MNVDQFYGIEIEEFPAQIAQVALWLMDHQMNLLVSEEFGLYFVRIPLVASSTIVCGNALKIDWEEVVARPACRLRRGQSAVFRAQWRMSVRARCGCSSCV
ncbi:MAG: hypothetical protein MZV65_19735 [Chromatiales bacterium]|nr:hypothetical protein [Chromatiales bacterium]